MLFGVMIAALLWTGSRGGLLALLVGVATVLVLRSGWRGMLVIVAVVGIVTLLPTPWRGSRVR
ncbi:MAG: hypothetical protein KatS3mg082_0154 [Nitrospiraceae bacterium]|nr:MAG: hypothetical protein KatS3mg082_0154 [Nitrospiraceae bacterium]